MLEAWLVAEPRSITTEEITDECNDRSKAPQSAGVRVRATVDAGPSAPQSGEHRTSICAARQSVGAGLDAANDPDIGSGPWSIGSSDCGPGRLQDVGSRCIDGTSGSGVCSDRKSTRLNSSHLVISYAVFC